MLTVLVAEDGRAQAKRITQAGTEPANPTVEWWTGIEVPVRSFEDLVKALDTAASIPAAIVVRGKIKLGVDRARMRRKHVGEDATLEEEPRQWLLLDLDKFLPDLDPAVFAADPGKYAAEARALLPEGLRRSACWWQATGSAGIKSGARLRMGLWLERSVSSDEAKRLARSFTLPTDLALYTPSQPHYVACPILDGVFDPCPIRTGILPGLPEAALPPPVLSDRADKALASAVRRITRAQEGERRNVLNAVAYSLASKFSSEELPADRLSRDLIAATGLPSSEATLTVTAAIRDGSAARARDQDGWRALLARDQEGQVKATQANVTLYFEHHPVFAGALSYDERAQRPVWYREPPWGRGPARPADEVDEIHAVEWFQTQAFLDVRQGWVRVGIQEAAAHKTFDPIQEYLKALPTWDGSTRVETFFCRHLGVTDTPLVRAQTRAWFISAYRRAFATLARPVQADYLLVLSGKQGLRKSSTLSDLCPLSRFFRSDLPDLSTPDASRAITDAWIVELAELTTRRSDRDTFKAFITRRVDKFRKPYGRDEIEAPRRAVFAGSCNDDTPLVDPTGNRRMWVLTCTARAELGAVARERDQLWAEAKVYAERGDKAYLSLDLEAAAAEAEDEHFEADLAEEHLATALRSPARQGAFGAPAWRPGQLDELGRVLWITLAQAADLTRDSRMTTRRLTGMLRHLKWSPRARGHYRERVWYPPKDWVYETGQLRDSAN